MAPPNRRATGTPAGSLRDEGGFALLVAMVAMLVLSIGAIAFMVGLNVETRVAGHDLRRSKALRAAEAGVAEAMSRIRNGDIPNTGNPRMVAQIFLAVPGQVPVLGADSVALATAQPRGEWLSYSTADRTDKVLTVQYKTDAARTTIFRYDPALNPPIQTATGLPIYVIKATGRKGLDRRTVVTEAIQKPLNPSTRAALAADVDIRFLGNSDVCGYNHRVQTPAGTKGRGPCLGWETGSGHLPGAWSSGAITSGGSSAQNGSPTGTVENQSGFYIGPWEALGMEQNEFFQWLGSGLTNEPSPPRGIVYLDNNDIAQDKSGSFAYHGGDGEGLLYVDGDLRLNGNVTFRGLIYVEGDLDINGTCWILGGIIVTGRTTIKIANGSCCILYSFDSIRDNIIKYGGQMVTLSWFETN